MTGRVNPNVGKGLSGSIANQSAGDILLTVGAEMFMVGLAAGLASINDEIGNIMVVFMVGLLIIWLMYHVAFTNAIPNLFKLGAGKGQAGA